MQPTDNWRSYLRRLRGIGSRLLKRGAAVASPAGDGLVRDFMGRKDPDRRPERLLFVALFDPDGIPTIREQVEKWCGLSQFGFDLLNLWGLREGPRFRIPGDLRMDAYDGLVIHCTTAYNVDTLNALDQSLSQGIAGFRGAKAVMKQDEHFRTLRTAEFLGSRGFHLVITMTRPSEHLRFYPRDLAGSLRFLPGLTGFVTEEMRTMRAPPLVERPIEVGYRGSLQPWHFGRLAWEKREIGEHFLERSARFGLTTDISSRWEDRFNGAEWFRFLCRCRAVLGVESGAGIVDFDGEAERLTQFYLAGRPDAPFEEVFREVLRPFEDNCYYKTISPRHFEAAACRCVQVLYEGDYAGIFHPNVHYIPLRRDFANIEDVVRQLRDVDRCALIAEQAFSDVLLNPEYSYERFVERVDQALSELFASMTGAKPAARGGQRLAARH